MFASRFPEAAVDYLAYNAGWIDKIGGEVVTTWPTRAIDFTLDEPYGVVAVIIPWNAPLPSLGQVLGPALAAGNTVVVKPPELAPFTALRVGELVLESGFPPGVVNVVPAGPVGGNALVRHPGIDKIHFTGSAETAKKILAGALENLTPVGLELGGKSALLVFSDADLLAAGRQAVGAAIVLSGQGCTNSTRLLVERPVYDRLIRIVKGLMKHTVVGDPCDDRTFMGPVVSAAACDRILGVITQARESGSGRLAVGGERLGGELAAGYFISPTLFLDVDNNSDLAQNEIFGPVVAAMSFDTEEQAIQLANDTRYGLAAYVYTNDLSRAYRVSQELITGNVWINGFDGIPPSAPFGGTKQSGYGRIGGIAGIREFTRPKNLWMSIRERAANTPNESSAL
jgi:acyl-CoA reductase-like NAD-dependent aldehyde dehydrogenase